MRRCCSSAAAREHVRDRRPLQPLSWAARRRRRAEETVRCPWHHACFDLRSGEAVRAPAFSPIDCWKVEQRDGRIFVREKREQPKPQRAATANRRPAGSSSSAAARRALRRPRCCGGAAFGGSIVMLSNDAAAPVDRPNLSKDYLAGSAPEDWLPLRPEASMPKTASTCVSTPRSPASIPKTRKVVIADGRTFDYDRLLLATGAEPVRLPIPGRRPAARPCAALARRLPRHHRGSREAHAARS